VELHKFKVAHRPLYYVIERQDGSSNWIAGLLAAWFRFVEYGHAASGSCERSYRFPSRESLALTAVWYSLLFAQDRLVSPSFCGRCSGGNGLESEMTRSRTYSACPAHW
jgi:hypothetical protein